MKNDLILRAARGKKVERTPVWVMRQAGRILGEYRIVRKKAGSFLNLVKNPELAAEVTLQPVDILGVDAAIIFSDILVVPEAMGLPYQMIEKKGPFFPENARSLSVIENLRIAEPKQELDYVLKAIALTKEMLNDRVPLIGFAGAPFTIFCYMVEGSGSKTFSTARKMLYQMPNLANLLLQKITDSTLAYLHAQIEAGVDMIQIFDSWAGILPSEQYEKFALPYLKQICKSIKKVPKIVFGKGAYFALESFGKLPCEVVGLDWNMNIGEAKKRIGTKKTLQGNLDPCLLYANPETIRKATRKMLKSFGFRQHIANLGHGVYPDTNPNHLKVFIEEVKTFSSKQLNAS